MSLLVLVVDDSMLIRHTVCRFLEEPGYTVESATNGEDALASIRRSSRSWSTITDIEMPRMSGDELISKLKGSSETSHIPIVIPVARARLRWTLGPTLRFVKISTSTISLQRLCRTF